MQTQVPVKARLVQYPETSYIYVDSVPECIETIVLEIPKAILGEAGTEGNRLLAEYANEQLTKHFQQHRRK